MDKNDILIIILLVIGFFLLLTGIGYAIKDEVCENTYNIKWYYQNCIGG